MDRDWRGRDGLRELCRDARGGQSGAIPHQRCAAAHDAHGAFQRVVLNHTPIHLTPNHKFVDTRVRANQLHGARMNNGRSDGNTQSQHKPHQREAGEMVSVAQGLHGTDYARTPG